MKRIFEVVRPYWRLLAIATVAGMFVSATNGAIAWLVKPAVDKVLVAGDKKYMIFIAAGIFAVFLVRGAFSFLQNYLMRSAGVKTARDLRNQLFAHLIHQPMSRYAKDSTGAMMSRVINDTAMIQELLAYRVRDLILESGTVVVLVGVALYMRWDLTLIALVVLPVAFYFTGKFGKRLKRVSLKAQESISEITESLSEGLSGIKIIKAFSMEDKEADRFAQMNQGYYRELMKITRIFEATSLIMEFAGGFGIAFVLWYGSSLVVEKVITTGEFFSFLTAILMIFTPAKRLTQVQNALLQATASLSRIDAVLVEPREAPGEVEVGEIAEIEYKNVSFRYEGRDEDALSGVSLKVKAGQVIALVGKSGSGKTTFVDLLAGFYPPTSGEILINGIDINKITKKSLRSKVGIVSQDIILFNDTVGANIGYGSQDSRPEEIENAARSAYADDFINKMPEGYGTFIGQRGIRVSGGERQRISIARAILRNPPVLILDEATSALDTHSEAIVQKALDNLLDEKASAPRTTFVIAHRLSTVKKADMIVVLDKGRIMETGNHDELLAKEGRYSRLHALQFGSEDREA